MPERLWLLAAEPAYSDIPAMSLANEQTRRRYVILGSLILANSDSRQLLPPCPPPALLAQSTPSI